MTSSATLRRRCTGPIKVILVTLIVAAVYFGYRTRSDYYESVSVRLAVTYAEACLELVRGYQLRTGKLPASLDEIRLPAGDAGFVPRLNWDPLTRRLIVDVDTVHGQFGRLKFEANAQSLPELRWECRNESVDRQLLPQQCAP
jgi:hypothetical protein